MANAIYPRTVNITRPNSVTPVTVTPPTVRALPYSGLLPSDETTIFYGLPASIQYKAGAQRADNKVPGDVSPGSWKILIPFSAGLKLGDIRRRDIVVDELGQRYQIDVDYFTSLGFSLSCTLLEL